MSTDFTVSQDPRRRISLAAIVSQKDGQPYVQLWGDLVGQPTRDAPDGTVELRAQLTVAEARELALRLLEAAAYAEVDRHVLQVLRQDYDLSAGQVYTFLADLRALRWTQDGPPNSLPQVPYSPANTGEGG